MAPTQLHPNTWASISAFRIICDVFRLSPTPSTFLNYHTFHPAKLVLWYSLIGRSGNVLFNSFATSYKNFKEKKIKVFSRSEGMKYFLMKPIDLSFPFFGLVNPPSSRSGLVRLRARDLFSFRRAPSKTSDTEAGGRVHVAPTLGCL